MYRADYHIHTTYSDGKAAPEEYIREALSKGLSEIGFSEHLTLTDEPQKWSIEPHRLPEYFEHIDKLRRKTTDLGILKGIEVDWLPGKEDQILKYISEFPFDYVIGSVHYLGTESVDEGREFYAGKDMVKLFTEYFTAVADAAASGLFDIIAHADLVRIYGNTYPGDPSPLYRKLASSLKRHDVAFEINTNGKNKPLSEIYPDPRFLHIFAEEKVPLCINSDAHMPSRLGQHFDEAYQLAAAVGFTEVALFKNRERFMIPLDI
jgi:histidinol-phosphatase (PHP family)